MCTAMQERIGGRFRNPIQCLDIFALLGRCIIVDLEIIGAEVD